MIKLKNGFYEEPETGFITLVVDNVLYDIVGDGVCMLPGNIPGNMEHDGVEESDDYREFLRDECTRYNTIEISDCYIPWLTTDSITVSIKDIDIAHAIPCNELWDKTRKYFNY